MSLPNKKLSCAGTCSRAFLHLIQELGACPGLHLLSARPALLAPCFLPSRCHVHGPGAPGPSPQAQLDLPLGLKHSLKHRWTCCSASLHL